MNLILASASPRRRDLMREAGYDFEVVPSPASEIHDPGLRSLCTGQPVMVE